MTQLAAAVEQSNTGEMRGPFARVDDLKQARDPFGPVQQGTLDMTVGELRGETPAVDAAEACTARTTPVSIVEYMAAKSARRLNRSQEVRGVLRGLHPRGRELRGWRVSSTADEQRANGRMCARAGR